MSSTSGCPRSTRPRACPATLSRPILTGLLRQELGFDGLVFTDSMSMHAISRRFPPEQAAAMAVGAGADVVLDPPDPEAALAGIRDAVESGEIPRDAGRPLGRAHPAARRRAWACTARARWTWRRCPPRSADAPAQAVAVEIASRAVTLLKDDRGQVPLRLPAGDARVLLLSVVDYASGWREGAPGRVLIPELKQALRGRRSRSRSRTARRRPSWTW